MSYAADLSPGLFPDSQSNIAPGSGIPVRFAGDGKIVFGRQRSFSAPVDYIR